MRSRIAFAYTELDEHCFLMPSGRSGTRLAAGDKRSLVRIRHEAGIALATFILSGQRFVRTADISIGRNCWGRPVLSGKGAEDIDFNISHTGTVVVAAACRGGRIGVDVEGVRKIRGIGSVCMKFMTEHERQLLADDEPDKQFIRLWTLKESCLKAFGTGWYNSPCNVVFDARSVLEGEPVIHNCCKLKKTGIHAEFIDIGPDRVCALATDLNREGELTVQRVQPESLVPFMQDCCRYN